MVKSKKGKRAELKKKKLLLILALCFLPCNFAHSFSATYPDEKIVLLTQLEQPAGIILSNDYIAISDGPSVKLFDRKSFNFIRALGREGQGPGEFQDLASPEILNDCILVSSTNKISYFNFDGQLIQEIKLPASISGLKKIKDKYVGYILDMTQPDDYYIVYNLYDANFTKLKELHKGKWVIHKNLRRELFEIMFYDTCQDKIVMAHRDGSALDILEADGNIIQTIKPKIKPVPFTKKDKEKVIASWKENGYTPALIDKLMKRTDFPDKYPPIMTCELADGKIYVITYRKKASGYESFIYDLNGKYLGKVYLPVVMAAPNYPSPFAIYDEHFYQLS